MLDSQSTLDALLDWVRTHYFGKYRAASSIPKTPPAAGA